MSGKLFIKTHGCQMNEYDSTKMADVLAASHGLTLTEIEAEADVILINTCSIREKAQEKVFSQLGRWRQLKRKNESHHRRRRLRRLAGRRDDHCACALCRSRLRPADPASAAGNDRSETGDPEAAGRYLVPGD